MQTLKLNNYNALTARLLAFLLFGVPGLVGFLYGSYLWFQETDSFTEWASLKDMGGPLMGLGITLIFGWLAATTDWYATLDTDNVRVRTLAATQAYGWPDLRSVALRNVKTKLALVGKLGPTVNSTLNVAFVFDAAGQQSIHEVRIRKSDVDVLVTLLQTVGRDDLLE